MADSNLSEEEQKKRLEALAAALPGDPVSRDEAFPKRRRSARSIAMHRAALEEARAEREARGEGAKPEFKVTRSPFAPKMGGALAKPAAPVHKDPEKEKAKEAAAAATPASPTLERPVLRAVPSQKPPSPAATAAKDEGKTLSPPSPFTKAKPEREATTPKPPAEPKKLTPEANKPEEKPVTPKAAAPQTKLSAEKAAPKPESGKPTPPQRALAPQPFPPSKPGDVPATKSAEASAPKAPVAAPKTSAAETVKPAPAKKIAAPATPKPATPTPSPAQPQPAVAAKKTPTKTAPAWTQQTFEIEDDDEPVSLPLFIIDAVAACIALTAAALILSTL